MPASGKIGSNKVVAKATEPSMIEGSAKSVNENPNSEVETTAQTQVLPPKQIPLIQFNRPAQISDLDELVRVPVDIVSTWLKLSTAQQFDKTPKVLSLGPCGKDGERRPLEGQELLDCIIPPKEWQDEHGKTWRQSVSNVPANKCDVVELADELERRIKDLGVGICMERLAIYDECFDEVIRQVTINCAETGLLLVACRDNFRKEFKPFQKLYESATAYGIRKFLQRQATDDSLGGKISNMQYEIEQLESDLTDMNKKKEESEKKFLEKRAELKQTHEEEFSMYKHKNEKLRRELEMSIAPHTHMKKGKENEGEEKAPNAFEINEN